MEPLYIAASPASPEVDFRFAEHMLSLKGESYPENAAAFYGPVIERLRAYLAECREVTVTVNVSLAYFNSSSTKMLFSLFEALNDASLSNTVILNWYRDEEDDTIQEFGEELRDDFPGLQFNDRPI